VPTPAPSPKPTPRTGDESNVLLYAVVMVVSGTLATAAMWMTRKQRSEK
jgi:LPXTG-motif cell wall-anchored protein